MWGQGHRRRRGRRGRFPKPINLGSTISVTSFTPSPPSNSPAILIDRAELETLRLVDLEGLFQEEAGERLGVSRGTVWRLLQSGRRKITQALTEGRVIQIVALQDK